MVKILLYRTMENIGAAYYVDRGFESTECELQTVYVDRSRPSYQMGERLPIGRYYNAFQLRQAGKELRSRMGKFDLLLVIDQIDQPFDMSGLAVKTAYWACDPTRSEASYRRLGDGFDYVFVSSPSMVPRMKQLFPSAVIDMVFLGAPEHLYFSGPDPKPVEGRPNTAGFMGEPRQGKRARWLKALGDAGFKIAMRDRALTTMECGQRLMDCSLSLNLSENSEVGLGLFESMAAGCISVTDSNADTGMLLEQYPDLFARTYDFSNEDPSDCVRVLRELMEQLKSNPKELSSRAQKAREEIRKNHLFSNRVAQILKATKLA
jgi:hypothetical protein